MNRALTIAAVCVLLTATVAAHVYAHSGGLDANGGHHDRRNGGYHYHRPRAAATYTPRPVTAMPVRTAPTAPRISARTSARTTARARARTEDARTVIAREFKPLDSPPARQPVEVAETRKPDPPAAPPVDQETLERRAASKLRLAKQLLRLNRAAAIRRFGEIMEEYPNTKAAAEAAELLEIHK